MKDKPIVYKGDKTMSEEFHDWLSECPVSWYRDSFDGDYATYTFTNE